MTSLTLYQYSACPFCRKVRAVLDYKRLAYEIVEVNPLSKAEIKWSAYKKVPILKHGDHQINDSDAIIAYLDEQFHERPLFPAGEDRVEIERMWRWVESLVFSLPPNIYDSMSEAVEAFDYISTDGKFSRLERVRIKYMGALAMLMITKLILKKKRGIHNPREHLKGLMAEWLLALKGRAFIGGAVPSVADLTCYGALTSVRTLKVFRELISKDDAFMRWFNAVDRAVHVNS